MPSQTDAPVPTAEHAPARAAVERILFVDDDPQILAAMKRQFHNKLEIVIAEGGAAGLEAINNSGPFAVVVSDLQMPGLDGMRFLAQMREKLPLAVPILLTGNADLQSAMAALNEGRVFRFLTKPCSGEVLSAAIRAALEKHRADSLEHQIFASELGGDLAASLRAAHEEADRAGQDLAALLIAEPAAPAPPPAPATTANLSIDSATGLPDWTAAEPNLRSALASPEPPFLAIFCVQRFDFACNRYGTSVGNHIMLVASHYLANSLQDATLFRWKGPVLLAFINPGDSASTVRGGLQQLVAASRPEYFQTATRSVFLRVKIEFDLLEIQSMKPEAVTAHIAAFAKQHA